MFRKKFGTIIILYTKHCKCLYTFCECQENNFKYLISLSLFCLSQGKDWQEARHHVNPILMQTKIVQTYTSKIDKVAEDFIEK